MTLRVFPEGDATGCLAKPWRQPQALPVGLYAISTHFTACRTGFTSNELLAICVAA
ncbi:MULTISPECIES: hypothetical protein [Tolypothrix]|uniref:Uncharacterized protein n=1 Tax=Tolypothrix bouteillei VB521301 TaxID=1479485 RepID=A0A8S9T8V2_9CYAN|nr:hypothetical protein [Tolypothrix bouteillei]KAF3888508.1 hypothetical protein DA73_0400025790 [Tolypothrix bouteillei VB521301]